MTNELEIVNNELVFNYSSFLERIKDAPNFAAKIKVFSKAINQEPLMTKNMREEMKKKGLNAGSSTDYDYIPIEVVEEGLRQIFFRQIDFEIKNSYRDLNSFIVVSTIKYTDPVTGQVRVIDGIGAKSLQQDKGSKIGDFNMTMKYNALELGVGTAYSRSIKNAAKRLGKAFGASLNRDEELESVKVFKRNAEEDLEFRLKSLWNDKAHLLDQKAKDRILDIINNKEVESYKKAILEMQEVEDGKEI